MAHRQRTKRGFADAGASSWFALFFWLSFLLGCSGGDELEENVASAQEALICGLTTCPANTACVTYACSKTDCAPTTARNGTACGTKANTGSCIEGACCTACYYEGKDGVPLCDTRGTSASRCGTAGDLCKSCVDGDACTSDVCSAGDCSNPVAPDTTPCSDGDACSGEEQCKSGKCVSPNNFSCDDKNPCTAESCDASTGCAHTPLEDGKSCEDANQCNGAEMCSGGSCKAGKALDCDDGNPCTDDGCDLAGGCTHVAVQASTQCDDGDVCNGISQCLGKVCRASTSQLNCDDGEVCTDDRCDPESGCQYTANAAACSDNDLCTTKDTCSKGKCVGGAAPNCDDNESCTRDGCDAKAGCTHLAVEDNGDCDDDNGCTTVDTCQGGKCVGTGGPTCDDGDPCTRNRCEVLTQLCSNPAQANGTNCVYDKCHQNSTCQQGACGEGDTISCDDNNPCTTDSCDAATGCKHVANNQATCSDGDACTRNDACRAGKCTGAPQICAPLDACHVGGDCDAKSGLCNDPRAEDGAECPGGACEAGRCIVTSADGGAGPTEPGAGGEPGLGAGGAAPAEGGAATAGGESAVGARPGDGDAGAPPVTIPDDKVFKRDPGGCSCTVPATGGGVSGLLALLATLGLVALRRRRSAA